MSRLSREQKRELKRQRSAAVPGGQQGSGVLGAPGAPPVEVHVQASAGEESGAGLGGGATVGTVPVVVAPGETVQGAVLNHLHRLALTAGHPVLAMVHDERIGFVVPLQVYGDGSSQYAGEPVRAGTPPSDAPGLPEAPPVPRRDGATYVLRALPETTPEPPSESSPELLSEPLSESANPAATTDPAPGGPAPSTFVLRAVPESQPWPEAPSTHVLRALPESARDAGAGVAVPPTGEFGPAPEMPPAPDMRRASDMPRASERPPVPQTPPALEPAPAPAPREPAPAPRAPAPERKPAAAPALDAMPVMEPEPEPKPTPVRGFDAVAEAVLAPAPGEPGAPETAGEGFLVEPVARINEAVKQGRIDEAAGMAERAVAEASRSLGPEHSEVLRLRELTAYIAYLAGDALRSFHLSLDLARVRRRHRDPGAAYGNVQSAATAWRAVRDPQQGLHLGRDLIDVWTELATDEGPAADDLEQLDSARTRMGRLVERARAHADKSRH